VAHGKEPVRQRLRRLDARVLEAVLPTVSADGATGDGSPHHDRAEVEGFDAGEKLPLFFLAQEGLVENQSLGALEGGLGACHRPHLTFAPPSVIRLEELLPTARPAGESLPSDPGTRPGSRLGRVATPKRQGPPCATFPDRERSLHVPSAARRARSPANRFPATEDAPLRGRSGKPRIRRRGRPGNLPS